MSSDLLQAIDVVSREKGIDPEIIISAVEEAIIAASKKIFKSDENFGASFNRQNGELQVWAIKEVVEEDDIDNPKAQISVDEAALYTEAVGVGDQIVFQRDTTKLGRIAAHAAKQVIMQKVRDAEKDKIHDDYNERVGEVITAVVRRFERGNVIMDIGNNVEGIMYRDEYAKSERFSQNDRTKVVIVGADRSTKEPQVKVSRSDARLLIKLFEMEVPEVYDQTVVIKNAAREAGDRSKIAVYSTDADVDPIGACVGMGGSRVRSIIRELKGERLDIIRYSEDIQIFASNALSPAKINRVILTDPENRRLEVIVDEDQLSLAIGKRGQNVRLASKLCGWSIEVKTEEQKRAEAAEAMERMAAGADLDGEEVDAEAAAAVGADMEAPSDTAAPMDAPHADEVYNDEDEYYDEEDEEEGVSLEELEGLSDEHREVLASYSIYYIEDILDTPLDVLKQIPELIEKIEDIVALAKDYEQQVGEEEDEEA